MNNEYFNYFSVYNKTILNNLLEKIMKRKKGKALIFIHCFFTFLNNCDHLYYKTMATNYFTNQ